MASSSWARHAMVSTSSPLAVQAALWALQQGGTAMDAALASDAALGVVQPFSTSIGGDIFCLVDDGPEVHGFNGSGAAPARLTLRMCQAERDRDGADNGELTPELPDTSPLSVTVPGVVDGWVQLSERFGTLGLARVLDPARRFARDGFPVGTRAGGAWLKHANRLRLGSPFAVAVSAGQRFANPALAASLDAIAAGGRDAHYAGRWAELAVASVREAGGVLESDDLLSHSGEWVTPIRGRYRDTEVIQLPPNGQGAAVLAALAQRDRESPGEAGDPATVVDVVRAIRDGMRLAHRHVADPRFGEVAAFWSGRDTVYTAVIAGGMAVSLISSVYYPFGSGISAGGAVVQNRGCGFSLDGGHVNVVAPRKRPFHTIIPAMLHREGGTRTVLGVVGGPMQPQGQVQVISHLVDHRRDAQAALDAPRIVWLGGDTVGLEAGFTPAVAEALRDAGFDVLQEPVPADAVGVGQVVQRHGDGWLEGGADPRRDGIAFGF
jgi:gamma-glutamyltranspeptidase/glutathione hydrolase